MGNIRCRFGAKKMPMRPGEGVLEGFAAVRARPLQFVGAADCSGIANMIAFVLKYAFGARENLGGGATAAGVMVMRDGHIRVSADGTNLPFAVDDKGANTLDTYFTEIATGASPASALYIVSAFSDRLVVTLGSHGRQWQQSFCGDESWTNLEDLGPAKDDVLTIDFWPRADMFKPAVDIDCLAFRLKDILSVYPGKALTLVDERTGQQSMIYSVGTNSSSQAHI